MFERYTESARRALFFARLAVSRLGGDSMGPEHVLLGVLRSSKDVAWRVCVQAGVTYEGVQAELKAEATSRARLPTSVEIPFSLGAKRVLEWAAEEADRLLHSYIGTEHLLLALLRDPRNPAGAILAAHGLELGAVRNEIVRVLGERGATPTPDADELPGVVSSNVFAVEHASRFERLRGLIRQLAALVDGSTDALALLHELQVELDELEQGPGPR